ncbi:uncharacterized protein TNCV_492271 [Trichonephila clavipes]|nr:uncharacterized protein TNCV_492271 [Trichonephila clavipes]
MLHTRESWILPTNIYLHRMKHEASGSSFIPTPQAYADNLREGHPRGAALQWRPTKFNLYSPEVRGANGFSVLPEVYFSGSENVKYIEGIGNQIRLLEISSDLSCGYLKGHLLGRAQDWYQVFGSALVQNTATDFAQLKMALSKAFPAICNKKDLEIRFYSSQQRRDQEPTHFIYDLLKLHKQLGLGMSEEAVVDHIFVRLEPQVQYYVEVRNPKNTVHLLEVLTKFEEMYSCKTMRGSRNSDNVERRNWNERRMYNADDSRRNWRNWEVLRRPSNGRNGYRGNYEDGCQGNQWFDSRNRFQRDDRRFNDRRYQF